MIKEEGIMNGKITDCYVTSDAVFYRLESKIDMATILSHRLNNNETEEQAKENWHTEQHWLADWQNTEPFEGYCKNCLVTFDMTSSRFYSKMKHGSKDMLNVRNITAYNIQKSK